MADRVRFLTRNDTVTPANSSGANGFSFPSYTGPGAEDELPFTIEALTLEEAIRWRWRVKNWEVTTDFQAGDLALPSGDMTPTSIEREEDLIGITHNAFEVVGGGEESTAFVTLWLFGPPPESYPFSIGSVSRSGSDYRPFVQISGAIIPFGSEFSEDLSFHTDPAAIDLFAPVQGEITALIDGKEIPLYYSQNFIGEAPVFTITQLEFTPVEFWPYAAAGGSPIYNTTTGAQLQDPRN